MHQIQLLKKYGLSVRGARGQHLLVDENIQRKFVEYVTPKPGETIIEIGPGLGAVTELLLKSGANVIAVEQDSRFVEILETELGREFKNLKLVHKDILKTDLSKFAKKKKSSSLRALRPPLGEARGEAISNSEIAASAMPGGRLPRNDAKGNALPLLKIVGNIPYYITSPILLHLISSRELIDSVYLTVQREIADRFLAQPGTKAYGRLALLVRFYAEARRLFEISRNCFSPKPNVDSTSIELIFHRSLPKSIDETVVFDVIKHAFGKRRKNIVNALSEGFAETLEKKDVKEMVNAAGLSLNVRAEELMLKDFIRLAELLTKFKK
jgi:16S rRNA (adenine1518-N6/adenine1519-N6)-dimethyltransferase